MQVGVRATFFINSDNLHLDDPALVAQNKESLVRMVTEGHVVGDHSYDHMAHNTINDSPRWNFSVCCIYHPTLSGMPMSGSILTSPGLVSAA